MKKILLIGDSICQGYRNFVKLAFKDTAEVYFPETNCRFAAFVLRNLLDWKNELGCGDDVDVIHWNAGLWDGLVMPDGKPLISFERYCEDIERVCTTIKILFPKAKMIFATSTPVQEELFQTKYQYYRRYNKDTVRYNAGACEIVLKHGGIINDLYSLMKDVPKSYYSDQTHFDTKEATQMISDQVIRSIELYGEIKAAPLNYDEIYCFIGPPPFGGVSIVDVTVPEFHLFALSAVLHRNSLGDIPVYFLKMREKQNGSA